MKKLLFTFFFGYASYKYRRLIRAPIILIAISVFIGSFVLTVSEHTFPDEKEIELVYGKYSDNIFTSDGQLFFSHLSSSNYYETPNGETFTEVALINRWGQEAFNEVLASGQLILLELQVVNPNKREFVEILKTNDHIVEEIIKIEDPSSSRYYYKKYNLGITPIDWEIFLFGLLFILSGFTVIGLTSYLVEPFVVGKHNEILETKTKAVLVSKVVPQVGKSNSSNNGIRKFKFLLVYFVIFWVQASVVVVISLTVIGPRPSGLIAFGGLLSFWTSYKITKYIFSKSKP